MTIKLPVTADHNFIVDADQIPVAVAIQNPENGELDLSTAYARAHLAHELAHFNALADEARIVKADEEWQARIVKDEADYLAAMALAGA